MKKLMVAAVLVAFAATAWASQKDSAVDQQLSRATQIVQQMTSPSAANGIPAAVVQDAQCVAVVPNMVKAGFIVGGEHGTGYATCRVRGNQWSPPAPFSLSGGSFGAQIGGGSVNLIMMVMNHQGKQALESGNVKVGVGASATAGPVGQAAAAPANVSILTYSHTNGAYAGATVKGTQLQQDASATKALYGRDVRFTQILNGQVPEPNVAQAQAFTNAVERARQTAQARR